jgi:hypothetical protein
MSNLRVWYGWSKINKIRKREAISVIFENGKQSPERTDNFIRKMQNMVYVRHQTDEEAQDAKGINRMFTEYTIFMDDKVIQNSLDFALWVNHQADKNNVSTAELDVIEKKLRTAYMKSHIMYKEPDPNFVKMQIRKYSDERKGPVQLELFAASDFK